MADEVINTSQVGYATGIQKAGGETGLAFDGRNAGWINNALECAIEKHVSFIRNFDHLVTLCEGFEDWYNIWRPHMTLDGLHPDDVYYDRKPEKPDHDSKTVPSNIEQHLFQETRVTGYRLKAVA